MQVLNFNIQFYKTIAGVFFHYSSYFYVTTKLINNNNIIHKSRAKMADGLQVL